MKQYECLRRIIFVRCSTDKGVYHTVEPLSSSRTRRRRRAAGWFGVALLDSIQETVNGDRATHCSDAVTFGQRWINKDSSLSIF